LKIEHIDELVGRAQNMLLAKIKQFKKINPSF